MRVHVVDGQHPCLLAPEPRVERSGYPRSARKVTANQKNPVLGIPTVGSFKNGRGELYEQEMYEGRSIRVRYVWSNITKTSAHFEQAFSTDGGATWEVNWFSDQTRVE